MDGSAEEKRRAQLEAFIAKSERARRVTRLMGVAFAAVAIVLHFAGAGGLAAGALMLGLFVAGTGMWISGGHIRDFQAELRALQARRRERVAAPH
ncbi:MAG TPA: hypothetical protein VIG06_11965 [Kofleriaceae bacterium]